MAMEFHSFKQLGESMIRREVDTTPEIIKEARRLHETGDREGARAKVRELRDIVAKLLEWDKRKDADAITNEVTDLLADLDERGFIYLMKDVVREGRWFTFLDAPAGLEPRVQRIDAQGQATTLAVAGRSVLPHVPHTTLHVDELVVEHGDAVKEESLQLAVIWPVAAQFLPEEPVTLEVFDPGHAGGSGTIEVEGRPGGHAEAEITLDAYGRGRLSLSRLDPGEYRAHYQPARGDGGERTQRQRQTTAFRVGEPRRSTLNLRVHRAFVRADRVAVRLHVSQLGQPFRGRAIIKISDRSTGKPVATISGYVKKGVLDIDFSVRNDVGPFDLRLEKGEEYTVTRLSLVKRVRTTIGQPGTSISMDSVPMDGGSTWLGMHLKVEEAEARGKAPWVQLASLQEGTAELSFADAVGPVSLVCQPALGGEEAVHSFEEVAAGETVSIPVPTGYAIIRIGAFVGDAVREASLCALRETPSPATLDSPARALPGDTVRVRVNHTLPTHSVLTVAPDTREVVDPYYQLRGRVVDDLMGRESQLGLVASQPRVIRHGKVTSGGGPRAKEPRKSRSRRGVPRAGGGRRAVMPPSACVDFLAPEQPPIFFSSFVGEGEFSREVTLPATNQRWRLTLFSVNENGFHVTDRFINLRGRSDFTIDLPRYVGTGDRIDGSIHYRTTREGALHIIRDNRRRSTIIKGSGREPLVISRPSHIEVELYEMGSEEPQRTRGLSVLPLDHYVGRVAELRVLSAGEEYERTGAHVVTSVGDLMGQIAAGLSRRPFEHTEMRAVRLGATVVLRDLVADGILPGSLEDLDRELARQWRGLASCQDGDGNFAPDPGLAPDFEITRQVLRCTAGLRAGRGFEGLGAAGEEMRGVLDAACRTLVAAGVRDGRLGCHTTALDREPEAFEEIAAHYLRAREEGDRRELAERIIDPVAGVEIPRWGGTLTFGGDDEATAEALKVCLASGHDKLFDRGINALAGHLVDLQLRSPSATLSLLELLALFCRKVGVRPEEGGHDVSGAPDTARVSVSKGRVLVLHETEASVPRCPPIEAEAPQLGVQVQVSSERVRPGDRIRLSILVSPSRSTGQEVTVLLPGILAFREGRDPQLGHFVMQGERLDLEVVAVRTGQGQIRAFAESVSQHDLCGVAPPPPRLICEVPPAPAGPGRGGRQTGRRPPHGRGGEGAEESPTRGGAPTPERADRVTAPPDGPAATEAAPEGSTPAE